MNTLLQDIRYGLRVLARSPGFAAIAILTLALGIGANTAIFSLIDAVLLRSLPVHDPSQIVLLKWTAHKQSDIHGYMSSGDCVETGMFSRNTANPSGCSFSEPMFREIAGTDTFAGVAAFTNAGGLDLTGNGPATTVNAQYVSGDFFRTMGLKAAAGRLLEPSDDISGAAPVAVLNYGYWQSAFGGSRDAMGHIIELNKIPFTIVGVVEQKFTGLAPGSDYDVWIPLSTAERVTNSQFWNGRQKDVAFWWLTIVARLKNGMPLERAQAAVSGLFRNEMLHGQVPIFNGGPQGVPGRPGAGGGGAVREMRVMGGAPPPNGMGQTPPAANRAAGKMPLMLGPGGNSPQQTNRKRPIIMRLPPGAKAPAQLPTGNSPERLNANPPARLGGAAQMQGSHAERTLSQPADNPAIRLLPAQSALTGARTRYADPLYVLMLAVGIILLIACANVAGLMLARAAARQKELAVRLALGAGRSRIVRQLLTESVLLSLLGGALGIVFAYWGAHAIVSFVSDNQVRPVAFAMGVDGKILGFTIAISLLTGILFGLAPAFRGVRVDLTPALKEGEAGSSGIIRAAGKWLSPGNALVVAQVALAIVVLAGAGLLVRTLLNLRDVNVGFDSHNLVIFGIDPTNAGYKNTEIDSFYRDLQQRLEATPGVTSVSYSQVPLLSGSLMISGFHWPGTPQDQVSEADMLQVGPGFFHTMQIPFVLGRRFNATDFAITPLDQGPNSAPAAAPTPVIVNQAFVEKFLGKKNPLGKRFGQAPANAYRPASAGYEIVGVVRDAKYNDLRRTVHPMMYVPQRGMPASFAIRTAANPQAMLPAIRATVAKLNANLPLFDVTTESQQIDRLLFEQRLIARLSGVFGALALALACIGLYGLLSYEVTRRTREIGIRMALGAQAEDVLRMVLKQGIALALAGAAAGVGIALVVTRYLTSFLYDVHADDPGTMLAVVALLIIVALAACYVPARRATRVDPMIALRYE